MFEELLRKKGREEAENQIRLDLDRTFTTHKLFMEAKGFVLFCLFIYLIIYLCIYVVAYLCICLFVYFSFSFIPFSFSSPPSPDKKCFVKFSELSPSTTQRWVIVKE